MIKIVKHQIGWLIMSIPGLSRLTLMRDGRLKSNWHFRIYERAAKWVNEGSTTR